MAVKSLARGTRCAPTLPGGLFFFRSISRSSCASAAAASCSTSSASGSGEGRIPSDSPKSSMACTKCRQSSISLRLSAGDLIPCRIRARRSARSLRR